MKRGVETITDLITKNGQSTIFYRRDETKLNVRGLIIISTCKEVYGNK